MRKFNPLNVSSKFAICGLPIRVDTYKTCSFGCKYCFSNYRKVMEFEKTLQIGDINLVEKKLHKILIDKEMKENNFLDNLISNNITWHCGGMSDPFQPVENKYHVTKDLIDITNKYNISIVFSTKSHTLYNVNLNPNLHSIQLSVTNIVNRKDIEPNVPDIQKRIQLFKNLKKDGFRVGIRIQPFIPNVTTTEIIDIFKEADYFTIEGLKLIPQNIEQREYLLDLFNIKENYFTQMGLLNLKSHYRLELYKPFIDKLEEYNIKYSIADNDLHYLTKSKCCCGENLLSKSTNFNNTAMLHKYGNDYTFKDLKKEYNEYKDCKINHLFTSNRQAGFTTIDEYYHKKFNQKSSPASPKFLYYEGNTLF